MNSESKRIAEQLRRAFSGDAWHGSPVSEILEGVTVEQAVVRPIPSGHNIWEITLHIGLYVQIALEATDGIPMPRLFGTDEDWPTTGSGEPAWIGAVGDLLAKSERLAQAIEQFPDTRLEEKAPGRDYDFYFLFHGIVQHSLYHAGQIAQLKRAIQG